MKKKIIYCILAVLMVFTATSCKKNDDDVKGDYEALLRIGMYDGGYKTTYIDKIITEFEKDYPQYKVVPTGDKTKFSSGNILSAMRGGKWDLLIASPNYYDLCSQNAFMDISDIIRTPLNQLVEGCNESQTIEDKMFSDYADFYSSYNNSDKYYAVPMGGGLWGINYDIDLFNSLMLFKDKSGNWCSLDGDLALGQDNTQGTYDDGLPISYEDWLELLKRMQRYSVSPFIWSSVPGYLTLFSASAFASFEGKENWEIMYNMEGDYTFEGDVEPTTITKSNAYLTAGMTGKKRALQFAKDIIDGGYYYSKSGSATIDYLTCQDTYLNSVKQADEGRGSRIAFIIDGSYWLNECSDTIEQMASSNAKYSNRRFGVMPFPQWPDQHADNATFLSSGSNYATFIRKDAVEADLAKLFLAYMYTDKGLQIATTSSGMMCPYEYELTETQRNGMDVYYQNCWDIYHGYNNSAKADIVNYHVPNIMVSDNISFFEGDWLWTANKDGKSYSNPFMAFTDKALNATVDSYYSALKSTYNESYWTRNFAKYF